MAFAPKALADGEIPLGIGTIFTATASIATYVKAITLFNKNAINQNILIEVNRSGVNRFWRRFELQQFESADVLDDGQTIILEPGDLLLASATTAAAVDFTISGVEEV